MVDRIHEREIPGFEGDISKFATELGRLTYDQVAVFLGALAAELSQQAEGDRDRGRPSLAEDLESASDSIYEAQAHIENAWGICLPHMRPEELESESELQP